MELQGLQHHFLQQEGHTLLSPQDQLWGGEFGRTPFVQGDLSKPAGHGRDHLGSAYSMWVAGGGFKGGTVYGETNDYCYNVARDPVHVHDLQATILHALGIDHTRLTYRYQGRDFRLTDVYGNVVSRSWHRRQVGHAAPIAKLFWFFNPDDPLLSVEEALPDHKIMPEDPSPLGREGMASSLPKAPPILSFCTERGTLCTVGCVPLSREKHSSFGRETVSRLSVRIEETGTSLVGD